MTQVSELAFPEEAAQLKSAARRLLAEQLPIDVLHRLVAADHDPERPNPAPWPAALWQTFVELGWTTLSVPEWAGGMGMSLAAAVGLVEEAGRAALPSPLMSTLQVGAVLAALGRTAAPAFIELLEGHAATLAFVGVSGSFDPAATPVRASSGLLSGTACFVQEAGKVARLLVLAREDDGAVALYWLAANAPGVHIASDRIVDLTRDQACVTFSATRGQRLEGDGLLAFRAAQPALWTLAAADIAGAAEWQLQSTVEYAKVRRQFDHPIGFFQAVKHPLVDLMIQIDQTRSLLYHAACAIDSGADDAAAAAHMAKSSAGTTAALACNRALQLHGGIGFTWEAPLHLYFKRQQHSLLLWGDPVWHRARLAEILLGPPASPI